MRHQSPQRRWHCRFSFAGILSSDGLKLRPHSALPRNCDVATKTRAVKAILDAIRLSRAHHIVHYVTTSPRSATPNSKMKVRGMDEEHWNAPFGEYARIGKRDAA